MPLRCANTGRQYRAPIPGANTGDREKAMYLLDESVTFSTELGMRLQMERVLSRRDIPMARLLGPLDVR